MNGHLISFASYANSKHECTIKLFSGLSLPLPLSPPRSPNFLLPPPQLTPPAYLPWLTFNSISHWQHQWQAKEQEKASDEKQQQGQRRQEQLTWGGRRRR
eukprot:755749-Hanusia_phi.AAC.7